MLYGFCFCVRGWSVDEHNRKRRLAVDEDGTDHLFLARLRRAVALVRRHSGVSLVDVIVIHVADTDLHPEHARQAAQVVAVAVLIVAAAGDGFLVLHVMADVITDGCGFRSTRVRKRGDAKQRTQRHKQHSLVFHVNTSKCVLNPTSQKRIQVFPIVRKFLNAKKGARAPLL